MLADGNTVAEDRMRAVFEKHGAFFAFSESQYKERTVEGVDYVSLDGGVIAPRENAIQLIKDICSAGERRIKEDIEWNGIKKIIWRELANHEAQITSSTESTFEALAGYNITRQQVKDEFPAYMKHCVDNDFF